MNRIWTIGCVGTLLCGWLGIAMEASAAPNIREGKWKNTIVTTVKMPGMPIVIPPTTVTTTQCMTKKDMILQTSKDKNQCTIIKQTLSGNKLSWKMRCTLESGVQSATGEIVFQKSRYRGHVKATILPKQPGTPTIHMHSTLSGHYLGSCD